MDFFITPWCILTIFCLEYKFQLLQILVVCTVATFVHYYKFQVLHDFFHVIIVQFEIFLGVAISAVFCKITCRIWILMHSMNPAILVLVFFIYLEKKNSKKIQFFFFFFNFFFLNTIIEFTGKVREGET